jgi:orotidine-5'-phosphate decarboxylase
MVRKVICALDTGNVDEAIATVKRLSPWVKTFKIGHGLTLPYGLNVIDQLQSAGAERIFLDLKFHDIPNSVALAVREAAKHNVWMMTLHLTGGPAMLTAAIEEAHAYPEGQRPLLVGVSVLTSLDQDTLTDHLGINRTIEEHMVKLSSDAVNMDLDGVVCSAHEIKAIRSAIGHSGIIVTPGIRVDGATHDQKRVGCPEQAIADGADYLVIGRALTDSENPEAILEQIGLD